VCVCVCVCVCIYAVHMRRCACWERSVLPGRVCLAVVLWSSSCCAVLCLQDRCGVSPPMTEAMTPGQALPDGGMGAARGRHGPQGGGGVGAALQADSTEGVPATRVRRDGCVSTAPAQHAARMPRSSSPHMHDMYIDVHTHKHTHTRVRATAWALVVLLYCTWVTGVLVGGVRQINGGGLTSCAGRCCLSARHGAQLVCLDSGNGPE